MKTQPIFIVGSPRSGTTLLAAMLAANSKLSCGPETHFFRWLSKADIQQLTDPTHWPDAAVDFVCAISRTSFSENHRRLLIDHYGLRRDQIYEYLQNEEPSIAAILSSITGLYMQQQGKQRWTEKTPDHIEHLPTIRATFPDAQIIRIIRDPRDVALSLSNVPWGVSSLMEGLLFWNKQDNQSQEFFNSDPNCYTVFFEQLISSPRDELENLCQYLGVDFEIQMLDTSQTGKNLNTREVPWKRKSSQPIDQSRNQVWRRELTRSKNALAEALVGDRLENYNYAREVEFNLVGEIFPSIEQAVKFSEPIEKLAVMGVRFWKIDPRKPSDVLIYLGDPEVEGWLQSRRLDKIRETVQISSKILQFTSARDRDVYWIVQNDQKKWTGFCSFLLKRQLANHRFEAESPGS